MRAIVCAAAFAILAVVIFLLVWWWPQLFGSPKEQADVFVPVTEEQKNEIRNQMRAAIEAERAARRAIGDLR